MSELSKMSFLSGVMIFSLSVCNLSWAGKLTVAGDMNIVDADYSNNWGDCGICVTSSNGSQPWQINLSGTLLASGNSGGMFINSSGNVAINAVGPNMIMNFSGNNQGGIGLNNEGGKLYIDGGIYGGTFIASDTTSSFIIGFQNYYANSLTDAINMNFVFENSRATSTYFAAINNKNILNISSTLGGQWITVENNYAEQYTYGIVTGVNDVANAVTNINGMNINISGNESGNSGIKQTVGLATSGKLYVTGAADGSNVYMFDNNKSYDWIMGSADWAVGSVGATTEISNMNIYMRGNEGARVFGFRGENAELIKITGVASGINNFVFSGNTATTGGMGGIYAQNVQGAGKIDIENMNILINDNSAGTYLYGIYGANTTIKGVASGTNSIVIKDNTAGSSGFYGITNLGTMNIENMNIEISNNTSTGSNAVGLYNSKTLNLTGIGSRNSMIIKDNKTAGFWTTGASAVTTVKNMNIAVSGNVFSIMTNGSTFNLENSAVNISDSSNAFEFGNTGNIINVKGGSSIAASDLMGLAASVGATMNVDNSYVSGKVETDASANSTMNLTNSAKWVMKSSSNLSNLSLLNSNIDIRSSSLGTYNTLTVKNYTGTGSAVFMNTFFAGDNSPTDKIVIDGGSATGTTVLNIFNTGGGGGTTVEGIKVVDAQGGATIGSGSFVLQGGKVDTGGYEYELYQGNTSGSDTESYFLRSNGNLTDTAKTMGNIPSMILSLAKAGMNSLMKRMGELRNTNGHDVNGVWARSYSRNMRVDDKVETKINLYGVEAGYDHRLDTPEMAGRLYGGGMIGYMYTDKVKTKKAHGNGSGNTPSVGAYMTWIGDDGWFVDGVVRHFWENISMRGYSSGGQEIKYDVNRQMTALSIEVGKQIRYQVENGSLLIEPKTEFGYAISKGETFRINTGETLKYGDTQSLSGKFAILLGYERILSNKMIAEPYIQLGIVREFKGKTNISYGGATYDSNLGGTSYEMGGGLNLKTGKHTSLYSELMYEKGSTVNSLSANVGFRYTW